MEQNKKIVNPRSSDKVGFLVISRRRDEGIMIGDNIHVFIGDIHKGQARLVIYAPKDVPIAKTVMAGREHV